MPQPEREQDQEQQIDLQSSFLKIDERLPQQQLVLARRTNSALINEVILRLQNQ